MVKLVCKAVWFACEACLAWVLDSCFINHLMHKLSWVYVSQQRFKHAKENFVDLLVFPS